MLMVLGFFFGVGGVIFLVGVILVFKYFFKEKVGLVNGIYGMGNIGIVVFLFLVLLIVGIIGW